MIISLLLACGSPTESGAPGQTGFTTLVDTGTPEATTPPTSTVPASVTAQPVRCPNPAARTEQPFDVWESAFEEPRKAWFAAGGLAIADFNGDDWLDLFIPGTSQSFFYLGSPEGFLDATFVLRGLPLTLGSGASTADYDGDGDPDLLVTRFLGPDVLLRNEGDHFVDVSAAAGLTPVFTRSIQSSWADLDRDGDLDLFVGSYGFLDEGEGAHQDFRPAQPSFLYLNNGDGTFTDVSERLPPEVHDGYTLGGGFHDLNRDLWPDLYVVNDFGVSTPNALLWNEEGTLVADDNRSGLDVPITGMGLAIADLNHDQVPDLFMPRWDGLHLYQSVGGLWFDWAPARELRNDAERDQKIAWGGQFVDLDHDGDLDLPVAFGHLDSTYPSEPLQPDALYIQHPDGRFVDEAPEWGFDHSGISRGSLVADLNGDGWMDVVVKSLDGPVRAYVSRCGDAAWLRLRMHQGGLNPDAIGARVHVSAGDQSWEAVVRAGGTSFASGGPPGVHFGLAEHEQVDVTVTWPDGSVSTIDGLRTRQLVDLTRGESDNTASTTSKR